MNLAGFAKLCSGRVHYAWIVLGIAFITTLAAVGVRAAPGVMIPPLQRSFGWDVSTISGAVSVNLILLGALGPFIMALMDRFGIKPIMVGCLAILVYATGSSIFMTHRPSTAPMPCSAWPTRPSRRPRRSCARAGAGARSRWRSPGRSSPGSSWPWCSAAAAGMLSPAE